VAVDSRMSIGESNAVCSGGKKMAQYLSFETR
jgi:hypothetical protein